MRLLANTQGQYTRVGIEKATVFQRNQQKPRSVSDVRQKNQTCGCQSSGPRELPHAVKSVTPDKPRINGYVTQISIGQY